MLHFSAACFEFKKVAKLAFEINKLRKFPMQILNFKKVLTGMALGCMMTGSVFAATLNVHNGGDASSLDPQKVSGDWENRIVGDIFEGLTTEDANAEPIPGQAESWEISDDGLVYTFKLRDGIQWSDGEPVTAEDFVYSFQRLMNPETAANYAYLQYPIKNSEKINSGEITDFGELGVKAIDDKTLEITLEQPTPYFLGALTHYTAYPVPKHVVEEKAGDWVQIENIVTNGPYKPVEWVPGSHVLTEINDKYYDADKLAIDGVKFFTLEDQSAALKRYRAGEFDILTDFPTDQFEWMQENLPGQARVAPFAGLYYYVMNNQQPPLDNADVRKALSMSVVREAIGPQILGTGEIAAYSWVPPGMANYPEPAMVEWKDLPQEEKNAEAKKLLEAAGYSTDNPLKLQLRYNTNENHKRIAVAIASMWKAIGVEVELFNTETKVHYAELQEGQLEVARAGWLADYNDADNFLNLLKGGIDYNYGRYQNPEFDKLLEEANANSNPDERAALLKQAEKIALDDSAAIPIYYYLSRNVVSPKVKGFEDNAFDIHRTRWLSIEE
jgi:oligopeptide transport system substrate-binding protein